MPSYVQRYCARPFELALVATLILGCAAGRAPGSPSSAPPAPGLPQRLGDADFWRLSNEMSEAGGSFQSDNFVSNERTFPAIVNALSAGWKPGGVYIGVGPEQNFAYIAALRPKMVFLLDIRRQMVMHHLMYKSLFELSADRAEFISRLFSKPRPAGLAADATVQQLWGAYWEVAPSAELFERNHAAVRDHLQQTRGLVLSDDDLANIAYVYKAFYEIGPGITYSGYNQRGGSSITYAQITSEVDAQGVARSFLASEGNYRVIRDLHLKNLIVPVVADFGGPTGIRAVGEYLKKHRATVTAFYTSNVESYLFREFGAADRFYANIASLPLDSMSTFIRPTLSGGGGGAQAIVMLDGRPVVVASRPGRAMATSELCPILAFLRAHAEGRIRSYTEARACPM